MTPDPAVRTLAPVAGYRVTFADGGTAKLVRVRTMQPVAAGFGKAARYACREWPTRKVESVTFLKVLEERSDD